MIRQNIPMVSIGLPVYNGEKYIVEAIESVLEQTFDNFELIISDNASTDKTEAICKEYILKDKRVKYIRQKENIGPTENFKFVVKKSEGRYFSWLAHDDCLNRNFIEVCSNFLEDNHDYSLISGDFLAINSSNQEIEKKQLLSIRVGILWEDRLFEFYRFPISNAFFCIYGLMRKDILLDTLTNIRIGPLLAASELPLLSRMAARGKVASLPHILRKYRYHELSSYHQEEMKLKEMRIKGRGIRYYNLWWNRIDQIFVLFGSRYSYALKIKTIIKIFLFYIFNFFERIKHGIRKINKKVIREKNN